jgi:uncharacterized protein
MVFSICPLLRRWPPAQRLTGAQAYWPEDRFLAEYSAGRITRADLCGALEDVGLAELESEIVPGLTRRDLLLATLLAGSPVAHQAQPDT